MIGRTITQPDASNSGERWESKQLVHEDDRRQLFEAKEASALETKLEDTHFGNTHLCKYPNFGCFGHTLAPWTKF